MLLLLLATAGLGGCAKRRPPAPVPTAGLHVRTQAASLRPQPKPGERVRQPELDGYCTEPQRSAAFYYHGGSPVVAIARRDGCGPLFLTECESDGRCYPPRDQEPGMWCCAAPSTQPAAQAAR